MKDKPLEVVTTEYKMPPDIMQAVFETKCNYIKKFREDPVAIILGPNEYLGLIRVIERDSRFGIKPTYDYPNEVMGMKIRIKQSNGIECEIPTSSVFFHAKGQVK